MNSKIILTPLQEAREKKIIEIMDLIEKMGKEFPVDPDTQDTMIFLSASHDNENSTSQCKIHVNGDYQALCRLLTNIATGDAVSAAFQRAILIAAANVLKTQNADLLAQAIGMLAEQLYGTVVCDCQKCKARREKASRNINVN